MNPAPLSPSEIEHRVPVWEALSELFRDTELQDHDYRHIAECLKRSGFDSDRLDWILRNEVAPAFHGNLVGYGSWSGWSAETVKDVVLSRMQKRRWYERLPFVRKKVRDWQTALVHDAWRRVRVLMT